MNIETVCRTCLKESGEMKSIFSKESEELLSNMVSACSLTKVLENDGFPTQMCVQCIDSLKISYVFKRQCESAYETLRIQLDAQLAFEKSFEDAAAMDTESEDELSVAKKSDDSFDTFGAQNLGPNEKIVQTEEISFYPCEMCEMKFMSDETLKMHRLMAHKSEGFKCRICSKIYTRLTHLRRHIAATHPGIVVSKGMDDLSCHICSKIFTRTEHLKRHVATHGAKAPKIEADGNGNVGDGDGDTSKESMNVVFLPSELIQVTSAADCKTEDEDMHQDDDDDEDEKPLISMRNKIDQLATTSSATNSFDVPTIPTVKTETISDHDDDDGGFDDGDGDDLDYTIELKGMPDNIVDDNDPDDVETDSSSDDETFRIKKSKRKSLRRGGRGKKKKPSASPKKKPKVTTPKIISPKTTGEPRVKERYPCEECKKVFVDPVKFETHKLAHAQAVKVHQCEKCEKTFTRANHLKRHMVTHSDVKPFSCDICEKKFSRIDHLNIHMHHHSDIKPHVCDICEKGFTRAEHLRNHKASRHGDRPPSKKSEICEICHKGFTTPKYLAVHMRSHTDRVYACKFCDEKFGLKNDLNEHSKKHVHEKPFLCSECGLRFVRNDYLVIHMRRHKGEKPYKCKYCGKGFPRATDLTVHERYHTGEKTHLCTTCGKGFQRAYNLLVHMRVHTGERPYQCPHCVKSFAQGNDLKAHVRRHTGERYKCDICGDGFIQGYHLTQHKRNVHGIDMKSHIRRVEKFVPIPKPGAAGAATVVPTVPDMQQLEQIEQLHRLQEEARMRDQKDPIMLMEHAEDSHHSQIVNLNDSGHLKAIKVEPSGMHQTDTQISDSQSSHDVTILSTMSSPRDQSHHSLMLDNNSHGQSSAADDSGHGHMNMPPYNMSLNLITSMHPKFKLPPTFQ